jgi:hypothetical protein
MFQAVCKRTHITHLHINTHKASKFNHNACLVTQFHRRSHWINITLQLVLVLAINTILNSLQHHTHDNHPNPDSHTKHTAHWAAHYKATRCDWSNAVKWPSTELDGPTMLIGLTPLSQAPHGVLTQVICGVIACRCASRYKDNSHIPCRSHAVPLTD